MHSGEKWKNFCKKQALWGIGRQPQENFKRHEKAREAFIYQRSRAFKSGAQETRTPDNADRQMSRNKKWRKSGKDLARAKI